jgi:predicted NAD-dependent protein-ADP-ribosyltransferase YbiA (DUF1768 family)
MLSFPGLLLKSGHVAPGRAYQESDPMPTLPTQESPMKVVLEIGKLVLVPETDEERDELARWKEAQAGHVFVMQQTAGTGQALIDIGPQADACREPIQVSSQVKDPDIQLIGNFASTPFVLDGRDYASVESFWQGLKFAKESERRRVAELPGKQARKAGEEQPDGATVTYEGETIPVGTWQHWGLMERACLAKFTQNENARQALLSTGERPLLHKMRRDSRSIPGVIMADIWMKVRRRLLEKPESEA